MLRIILFSFLVLSAGSSFAQQYVPFYDLQKDKPWIDSLKDVARKVDKTQMYERSALMKVYMDANMQLGNYYEKMYEKKLQPDLSQALIYYHNITDLGVFLGWSEFLNLMAIRNNLCRKISSYYFFGKGTPKDYDKALDYAARGIGTNKELFSFYSKRFFNSEETILGVTKKNDSVYVLKLNPFAVKNSEYVRLKKSMLNEIAQAFSAKKFQGRYLHVSVYNRENIDSYENAEMMAEMIRDFFVKEFGIDEERTSYYSDTDVKKVNVAYVYFRKNKTVE